METTKEHYKVYFLLQYAEKPMTVTLHIAVVFKTSYTCTSFKVSLDRQQSNSKLQNDKNYFKKSYKIVKNTQIRKYTIISLN